MSGATMDQLLDGVFRDLLGSEHRADWPSDFDLAEEAAEAADIAPRRARAPVATSARARPRAPTLARPVATRSGLAPAAVPRGGPERVRWIQQALNQLMGLQLTVDGVMGSRTREGVRRFQRQQGLVVDGIVGPRTEQALAQRLAAPQMAGDCPIVTAEPQATVRRFGRYNNEINSLPPDEKVKLDEIVDLVKRSHVTDCRPVIRITCVGHADPDPAVTEEYAQRLSADRAKAACDHLQRQLPKSMYPIEFSSWGNGWRQPEGHNHEQNRRVQIFLEQSKSPVPRKAPPRCGTSFLPSTHGFRFANSFSVPQGICGGMSFMATDYWYASMPIPPDTALPGLFSSLRLRLIKREKDMLLLGNNSKKFLEYTPKTDDELKRVNAGEFRKVIQHLCKNKTPVPLGLVLSSSNVFNNHVVVVYESIERSPLVYSLRLYDPNHQLKDDVFAEVVFASTAWDQATVTEKNAAGVIRPIRCFFKLAYLYTIPTSY